MIYPNLMVGLKPILGWIEIKFWGPLNSPYSTSCPIVTLFVIRSHLPTTTETNLDFAVFDVYKKTLLIFFLIIAAHNSDKRSNPKTKKALWL